MMTQRTNRQWGAAIIILAALLLSGCGKSQAELDAEAATRRAEEARRQLEACLANAESVRDANATARDSRRRQIETASGTIRSKLDPTGNAAAEPGVAAGYRWRVRFASIDGTRWDWTETEERAVALADGRGVESHDVLTYSLDPRQLSPEVGLTTYLGSPAVRISCRSSDCIHVTGARSGPDGDFSVDEQRDDNNFPAPNEADARAVAAAIRQIINLSRQQDAVEPTCTADTAADVAMTEAK